MHFRWSCPSWRCKSRLSVPYSTTYTTASRRDGITLLYEWNWKGNSLMDEKIHSIKCHFDCQHWALLSLEKEQKKLWHTKYQIPFNKDEQNGRFCWLTSQLILMFGILIGGRFCAFTCPTWNFVIWKQQNLHVKENDQHLVQLLPNKLFTPFTTVLLVSINVFG